MVGNENVSDVFLCKNSMVFCYPSDNPYLLPLQPLLIYNNVAFLFLGNPKVQQEYVDREAEARLQRKKQTKKKTIQSQ